MCSALLGKDEPHSLRLGMVATQPGPPFGSISDQQLWKIHGVTVSPLCRTVALSRCVLKRSLQHQPDRRTVMSSIRRCAMWRRFSEEERQTIWDMREAGVPVKRIARHLGRQNVSLRKFIADAGGKRPTRT